MMTNAKRDGDPYVLNGQKNYWEKHCDNCFDMQSSGIGSPKITSRSRTPNRLGGQAITDDEQAHLYDGEVQAGMGIRVCGCDPGLLLWNAGVRDQGAPVEAHFVGAAEAGDPSLKDASRL